MNIRLIKSTLFIVLFIIGSISSIFLSNYNLNNDINKEFDKKIDDSIPSIETSSNHPPNADDFTYYKKITIHNDKVSGTTNLVNFPMLISIFDSDLHYYTQHDGDDIAFAINNTWLDHEIELYNQTYNNTHAQLIAWVRIPHLLTSEDTIIRMYYGNSYIGPQENPEGVWDTNYVMVQHMKDKTISSTADSTSYSNDGTKKGVNEPNEVNGSVYKAQEFDGNDDYLNMGDPSNGCLDFGTNDFTVSAWVKTTDDSFNTIISKGNHDNDNGWTLDQTGGGWIRFRLLDNPNYEATMGPITIYDGQWHHIVGLRKGDNLYLYSDGQYGGSDSGNDNVDVSTNELFKIGARSGSIPEYFNGTIDEVHVSRTARSADWIATEYNNQYNPSSFYSIGSYNKVIIPAFTDFEYYKIITIDYTKVSGTSNLVNFPVLVSLFDSDLYDHAQSDGDDIAFSDGITWLDHEIELFNQTYNSTHAQLVAWVRIPTLFSSINTKIYMYYGNPIMQSQQNPFGVWTSGYCGVWHLSETKGGTDTIKDSSYNANHGTDYSNPELGVNGKIGRATDFAGYDTDEEIRIAPDETLNPTYITVSAWIYPRGQISAGNETGMIVSDYFWEDGRRIYTLYMHRSNRVQLIVHSDEGISSGVWSYPVSLFEWHLVHFTVNEDTLSLYIDGELPVGEQAVATDDITGGIEQYTNEVEIGSEEEMSSTDHEFNGTIDEVRISNFAHSANWIATEYNNQYNPNNFYSIGPSIKIDENIPSDAEYFDFYKLITIDSSKIPGSGSLINFPVLISLFDSDLHDDVQPDGDDIAFAINNTWLDHEIELFNQTYNSTHAQLVAWVRIPSLSTSIDTIIHMYYGCSYIGPQENPNGVWNANYKGVWHLSESSGNAQDSTSYATNGNPEGGVTQGVAGHIDGAYEFDTDETVNIGDPGDGHLDFGLGSFTVSLWINVDAGTATSQLPLYKGASIIEKGYCFSIDPSGNSIDFHAADGDENIVTTSASITLDDWIYIIGMVDRENNRIRIYKDGSEIGSGTNILSLGDLSGNTGLQFSQMDNDFDGILDEVRISSITYSNNWILTEYNNQHDPDNFYSVGEELSVVKTICKNLQVDVFDLYNNLIPDVNISIYKNAEFISSNITGTDGSVSFTNIFFGKYNFTATITSDIGNYVELVNITSEAILINNTFQTISLVCNVSPNFFNIFDVDGNPVDSGWIIVGNSSNNLQNCTIDNTGNAQFWWLNTTPYEYNYTIHYQDENYNRKKIILASGDIITPNSQINLTVLLTTVNFTVITQEAGEPVSGVKLILRLNDTSGESIVNLTTNVNGKATLRWLNSSGINGNYSLQIGYFGGLLYFNSTDIVSPDVTEMNFTVSAQATLEFRTLVTLDDYETELISLNPTKNIEIEWGLELKLRILFNVSKAKGHPELLGPIYADSMSYQILFENDLVSSDSIPIEEGNLGRHQVTIDTSELNSEMPYVIIVSAQKSGFTLPSDLLFSLYLQKIDLLLNQSENDDSIQTVYWLESVDISVKPYGEISEDMIIEDNLFQDVDNTFKFLLPDISSEWNLSQITFNIYNISWNVVDESDINITIKDPRNDFWMWNYSNAIALGSEYNYPQGWWKGITLNLDMSSRTGDNVFKFTIEGSFDGTVDIIAHSYFIRDKVNIRYSEFNVTDDISILSDDNGWLIKNITFNIYNCRYSSNWSLIDDITTALTNITTNEGYTYLLVPTGGGTGRLCIDNITIYPVDGQFFFDIGKKTENVMFDVNITIEYYQGFYWHHHLENISTTIIEQGFNHGGVFTIVFTENFGDQGSYLLIRNINNGTHFFFPSELAMNITIGQQTYSILNTLKGEGTFSLEGFNKDIIYSANITTNQPVDFTLSFKIIFSRIVYYETEGTLTYVIREAPDIYGTVQNYYDELVGVYYLQTIDSALLDANDYTIRFTVSKNHYNTDMKDLYIEVLDRETTLNGETTLLIEIISTIYVKDAVNFTFSYIDKELSKEITNLRIQSFTWKGYSSEGIILDSGSGVLNTNSNSEYILDFNTEKRAVGKYTITVTLDKDNYEFKIATITLMVINREIDYDLGDMFEDKQTSVVKGETITLSIELTDPTKGDIPLTGATVILEIGDEELEFEEVEDGVYELEFDTKEYEAFFTSNTITGTIKISKANYTSEDTDITIVIEMEEIEVIPGVLRIPTFYLMITLAAIVAVIGSLATYKYIQLARIPKFVKKIRAMKAAIKKSKVIPETLSLTSKDVYAVSMVSDKWETLGFSIDKIFGIPFKKGKILPIVKKETVTSARSPDLMPFGLILMRWNERIGTEILVKYPEEITLSKKTLMQLYGTHEYTGESGMINLLVGNLNIASYYTGPEKSYYLVLILNLEDDADAYEGGMADVLQVILQNLDNDAYLQLIPSLFRRLAVYPTLNNEQKLANTYQHIIKRMIITRLRDEGIIDKSELMVWLKDKYKEGLFNLEVILLELIKGEIIKQVSVKGMPSELNFLASDLLMLRTPPVELVKNPGRSGLPAQFAKNYLNDVKKFFEEYHPTIEDNIKIVDTLTNTQVYHVFQLLRTAIVTQDDLEKLKKKGVDDATFVLKTLWQNNMIRVYQEKDGKEYYALLSDFYIRLVFPKYILGAIKEAYEQRSKNDKVLIEYLNMLEDSYLNLKSEKKSKE